MAELPRHSDTIVRCPTCGAEKAVHFGTCLASGWPKCCGYTMTLVATEVDVADETTRVLRSATEVLHG